jgi:hypothetical protein
MKYLTFYIILILFIKNFIVITFNKYYLFLLQKILLLNEFTDLSILFFLNILIIC